MKEMKESRRNTMDYNRDYKTDDPNWFRPIPDLRVKSDLEVSFLRLTETAKLPERAHDSDAGWDVFSDEDIFWKWYEEDRTPKAVSLGLKMILPVGWEAQMRPRSGMSLKGWRICNSPGTIDAGYRGVMKAIVAPPLHRNPESGSDGGWRIDKGQKICQLVFKRVPMVSIREVSEAEFQVSEKTQRGEGGFGSTGT